jgi:hypothetical protein
VTSRRGLAACLLLIAVPALAAGACIPARPSPTPGPATQAPPPTEAPSPTGSIGSAGVVVDPALLDLLPREVDGVPLKADPESAAEIVAEGSIAPFVSAIALATAFGPMATDTPGDYVVVNVARLRSGTFSDLFFRGWRDTFDSAVCDQAGGVDGHAEADIGGHRTFIGTCAGGVHTYHVHLPAHEVIVSMQGLGEARYAELVVAGLTESGPT